FGENFTVDGLPDGEVCIRDRYRIGSAVFEVDAASAREDRDGRPRHQSGSGSPLGRLRRQRLRG
ncbi:MAG: MOSC domain-containing protein, partial [Methylocella sp.]